MRSNLNLRQIFVTIWIDYTLWSSQIIKTFWTMDNTRRKVLSGLNPSISRSFHPKLRELPYAKRKRKEITLCKNMLFYDDHNSMHKILVAFMLHVRHIYYNKLGR